MSKPGIDTIENLDVSFSELRGDSTLWVKRNQPWAAGTRAEVEPRPPAGRSVGCVQVFHCWAALKNVIPFLFK